MLRLRSHRIITPAGTRAGEVVISEGRIAEVVQAGGAGPHRAVDGDVIDVGERWLVPGFIDLHVHGGGGAQCNTVDPSEVLAVARFHAGHGTTGLLATTVAAPLVDLEASLRAIQAAGRASDMVAPAILGAHLEGPFLSPARPGAMDPAAFCEPDAEAVMRLITAGHDCLRMMTLAPELPGAREIIAALQGAGAVVSLGHTDATYEQAVDAVRAGARSVTHTFNAMGPLHQRHPGVLGAALERPELNCELIVDARHVHPVVLRVAMAAKGLAGVRLVTDAIQAAGMPDGLYRLGSQTVEVVNGRALTREGALAGSTLTMDVAVRNAIRCLGVSLPDAVRMASANPARVLGLQDVKGSIAPGADADLVVLDEQLRCRATMIRGCWMEPSGCW